MAGQKFTKTEYLFLLLYCKLHQEQVVRLPETFVITNITFLIYKYIYDCSKRTKIMSYCNKYEGHFSLLHVS